MFSAVSGIALVLAAIFFLRYSIDHGWLAPPVRLAIGVLVGTALLVVCELKAARNYRVTRTHSMPQRSRFCLPLSSRPTRSGI